MAQLQATIVALIGKSCAQRSIVALVVLVVRVATTESQIGKTCKRIAQLTAYIQSFATQVCSGRMFTMCVIVLMLVSMIIFVLMSMVMFVFMLVVVGATMERRAVRMAAFVFMAMA